MPKIYIIPGSTRPYNVGKSIAYWLYKQVEAKHKFDLELIDLTDWSLPFLDEPVPAKGGVYKQDHTKAWSTKIAQADGFILVTPEYNHSYPAPLKNALDYLYDEWSNKPVAFVGYGWRGASFAIKHLREVVNELHMQPIDNVVAINFQPDMFNEQRQIINPEQALSQYSSQVDALVKGLGDMLDKK